MKAVLALLPLLALCGLAAAAPVDADSETRGHTVCPVANSGLSPRDAFARYVDRLYNHRDIYSLRAYWNPSFLSHDPFEPSYASVELPIEDIRSLGWAEPTTKIGIQTIIPPCPGSDRAVIHYRYETPAAGAYAAAALYRYEGSCVAEFWLVVNKIEPNATAKNPNADFDIKTLATKAEVPKCSGY